jgi:hypothetical protein
MACLYLTVTAASEIFNEIAGRPHFYPLLLNCGTIKLY